MIIWQNNFLIILPNNHPAFQNLEGYAARIEYSDEDGCCVGHIAGINDIVGFHGESVSSAKSRRRNRARAIWTFLASSNRS
jgi:predicted HicB family RNase H-like nuclease